MVVPTDIQVAFVTGAFFVDVGRKYIEEEHKISHERSYTAYCRFRNMSVLYATCFLSPVIAVFFSAWPAWETQYWTAAAERLKGDGYSSILAGLFLLLLVGAAYLGNWLSYRWIISGRGHMVRPVYLAILAITAGIYLYKWPAPVRLGSFDEFNQNPSSLPYIWENPQFFLIFILLLLYCAIPYIVVFFRFRGKASLPFPNVEGKQQR